MNYQNLTKVPSTYIQPTSFNISQRDTFLWNDLKQVSLSLIRNTIRKSRIPPSWVTAVWHCYVIPKCAFFTWLLKLRLLTKDRMVAYEMNVNPSCFLCGYNMETSEHFFTLCPYTNLVLHRTLFKYLIVGQSDKMESLTKEACRIS